MSAYPWTEYGDPQTREQNARTAKQFAMALSALRAHNRQAVTHGSTPADGTSTSGTSTGSIPQERQLRVTSTKRYVSHEH